jgi:hypothetical protein
MLSSIEPVEGELEFEEIGGVARQRGTDRQRGIVSEEVPAESRLATLAVTWMSLPVEPDLIRAAPYFPPSKSRQIGFIGVYRKCPLKWRLIHAQITVLDC